MLGNLSQKVRAIKEGAKSSKRDVAGRQKTTADPMARLPIWLHLPLLGRSVWWRRIDFLSRHLKI
jgi:hypothetical protein